MSRHAMRPVGPASVRPGPGLVVRGLLGGLLAGFGGSAVAAESPDRSNGQVVSRTASVRPPVGHAAPAHRTHAAPAHGAAGRAATPARSGTRPGVTPAAAGPAENLVVHGARRYTTAPMPNQAIHDPADSLRDPATGAALGAFGRSYLDANPVPPVNPGLKGDQGPIVTGIQR